MKYYLPLLLIVLSCNNTHHETQVEKKQPDTISAKTQLPLVQENVTGRILAGTSIGKVVIGSNAATLETLLGRPDRSDAAMGKAWLIWEGRRDAHNNTTELDIYISYRDNSMQDKIVRQIRTTSTAFTTEQGTSVYASFEKVKTEFPGIKKAGHYKEHGRSYIIYDDKEKGIAFEFVTMDKEQTCTGIIVHEKGKSVHDIYITFHPEMIAVTDVPA